MEGVIALLLPGALCAVMLFTILHAADVIHALVRIFQEVVG